MKERTQLNVNIDPDLLLILKRKATQKGQTLAKYVTSQLKLAAGQAAENQLEQRLLRIEENLGIKNAPTAKKDAIGVIFTEEGAKNYGEVARQLFESHAATKHISIEVALQEFANILRNYPHSNPELCFQILLGNHSLSGLEMTQAYRFGSCALRSALCEWTNNSLEPLNDAFLAAVITKNLAH